MAACLKECVRFLWHPRFFIAVNAMAQDQDVPKGAWWTEPSVVKALNLKENEIEQLEKAYWEYKSIIMNLNNQVSTDQLEIDSRKAKNSFNPQRKERIIRELKGKVKKPALC
jgi:hypothetical protein